ncbi:hypothetical protein PENTCL1PPCAC_18750, partial [Pristionchus entomophagus]
SSFSSHSYRSACNCVVNTMKECLIMDVNHTDLAIFSAVIMTTYADLIREKALFWKVCRKVENRLNCHQLMHLLSFILSTPTKMGRSRKKREETSC